MLCNKHAISVFHAHCENQECVRMIKVLEIFDIFKTCAKRYVVFNAAGAVFCKELKYIYNHDESEYQLPAAKMSLKILIK